MLLGRLSRVFEFRRQLGTTLNRVRKFLGTEGGRPLNREVQAELRGVPLCLQLAFTDLRAEISGEAVGTSSFKRGKGLDGANAAGLDTASTEAIERCKNDRYNFQFDQYVSRDMLENSEGSLRLPSLVERERLMSFDENYRSAALPDKCS